MEQWSPILIAVLMSIPPLLSQYFAAKQERDKLQQAKESETLQEWRNLYDACRVDLAVSKENERQLEAKLDAAEQTIADLREQLAKRPLPSRSRRGRKTST